MIEVKCGACGAVHKVKDELAGRRAKCKCGAPIAIPAAPTWNEPPQVSSQRSRVSEPPKVRTPEPVIVTEPVIAAPVYPQAQPIYQQPAAHVTQAVQVNVQPRRGNSLAVASIIVAVLAVVTVCIPFISLPLALLGGLLAVAGVLVCLLRRGTGLGFSIAGGVMSVLAGFLSFAWGEALFGVKDAVADARRRATAQAESTQEPAPSASSPMSTAVASSTTDSEPMEEPMPEKESVGPAFIDVSQPITIGDIRIRVVEAAIDKVLARA